MFNPKYILSDHVIKNLTDIAEAKSLIDKAKLLPKHELRLKRQAIIRMSHSSTAIEGNALGIRQVEALLANKTIDASSRDIYEVKNYIKVVQFINLFAKSQRSITQRTLLKIHSIATNKTLSSKQSGHYRTGHIYVVRRKIGLPDEVVYTGPKASLVSGLCNDLFVWIKANENKINPVVMAGITHLEVAAIHPFNDGNGRTARALATLVLYKLGYDFRHLFALEDYYNKDLQKYYQAINTGNNYYERKTDCTEWLEYFISGFLDEIINVKKQVTELSVKNMHKNIDKQVYLNQKQLLILVFLDQLGRISISDTIDILKCPKRTAQLELQKLKKLGIIEQISKGPATHYILKK